MDDLVENGRHVADVVHVEYGVKEFALSTVVLSCKRIFNRYIMLHKGTHLVKRVRLDQGIFGDT